MNDLIPTSPRPLPCQPRSWLLPMVATLVLHTAAAWGLYASWSPEPPAGHSQPVMITQLVTLPAPAPEPEPVPPPAVEPVAVDPEPAPAQIEEPQIDRAAIARKRLEEQQQKEHKERAEQQRLAEQRRQQEQERERQQQLAREQQERERAEQQALAEQQRQAAEAQARADAEAARRAAEAAAIAQYQPISKQPPSYPRRALDRGLEGDCTVTYTVTRDGRVKNPQVVEGACDDPLFERPSLTAARSFRYQPRLIDGQPVDVPGIRNTFRYRIQ